MRSHHFSIGQVVRFTTKATELLDGNRKYFGTFKVTDIKLVSLTNIDPFSPGYMGEQEGQDAVGHHQLVMLERHQDWISGALIEPAPSSWH